MTKQRNDGVSGKSKDNRIVLSTELGDVYADIFGTSEAMKPVYGIFSIPYARAGRFEKPERITTYHTDTVINRGETVCFPQHGYPLWVNRFMKHHMMRPEFLPIRDRQTEDAFVVNIWTDDLTGKKPVTVFLHGGGEGSGTVPIYCGDNLAKKGIVAVTVTYRIGCFGYMPVFTKDKGMTADLAYYDQQAALLWIRENIRHFGGDPHNITLVGHCGGGLAALYHFLNPVSNRCFDKLMLLCGNLPTLTEREQIQDDFPAVLKHYKAENPEQLKHIPAKAFLGRNPVGLGDVIDGDFISEDPIKLLEEGKFPAMPVVIGTNADEFSMVELPMYYRFLGIATKENKVDEALQRKYGQYGKLLKDKMRSEASSLVDLQIKIMELTVFHSSAYRMMELIGRKCPVYGYRLHYVPDLYHGLRGSYHGAELVYFFDNLDKMNIPITDRNREQVDVIQKDWIAFVHTGTIPGRVLYAQDGKITDYDEEIHSVIFPHRELIKELMKTNILENTRRSYIRNMKEPTGKA